MLGNARHVARKGKYRVSCRVRLLAFLTFDFFLKGRKPLLECGNRLALAYI
jgi:hypothetical protein